MDSVDFYNNCGMIITLVKVNILYKEANMKKFSIYRRMTVVIVATLIMLTSLFSLSTTKSEALGLGPSRNFSLTSYGDDALLLTSSLDLYAMNPFNPGDYWQDFSIRFIDISTMASEITMGSFSIRVNDSVAEYTYACSDLFSTFNSDVDGYTTTYDISAPNDLDFLDDFGGSLTHLTIFVSFIMPKDNYSAFYDYGSQRVELPLKLNCYGQYFNSLYGTSAIVNEIDAGNAALYYPELPEVVDPAEWAHSLNTAGDAVVLDSPLTFNDELGLMSVDVIAKNKDTGATYGSINIDLPDFPTSYTLNSGYSMPIADFNIASLGTNGLSGLAIPVGTKAEDIELLFVTTNIFGLKASQSFTTSASAPPPTTPPAGPPTGPGVTDKYNPDNKPVLDYTQDGRPIYGYDKDTNKPILGWGQDNRPIFDFDSQGRPIYGWDADGKAILAYENDGRPIIGWDANGKAVYGRLAGSTNTGDGAMPYILVILVIFIGLLATLIVRKGKAKKNER
jgi:hypothetical protein